MRIGIVFGCFIPLHKGHISLIERALQENDKVIVAVCGKETDRGQDFIPFSDRITLIKRKYHSGKYIISMVDDEKLKLDGSFSYNNWVLWCTELFANAGIDPYDNTNYFTWYTGEPSYKEVLNKIYENHEVCLIDRSIITISGTKIRENPMAYKDYIAPEFFDYLKKKGITNET